MDAADDSTLEAWAGRRVLVTGHTGFKGSWLVTWLSGLGAQVTGLALAPPAGEPAMFTLLGLEGACDSRLGDIRDLALLRETVRDCRPEVVFHLAAQPLVRLSYETPLETFDVNVRGTATLLEAIRLERQRAAILVVTSDKCYREPQAARPCREGDPLGGHDPYSASKAAAELVTESYRRSFFAPERIAEHGVALASARAGNVIGGGDWGRERLFPMIAGALGAGRAVELRAPAAVRPWQHVLEPLSGYLTLGARLMAVSAGAGDAGAYCGPWNFGPTSGVSFTVAELTELAIAAWGPAAPAWRHVIPDGSPKHEAEALRLDASKAATGLGWWPRLDLARAVERTVAWYRAHHRDAGGAELLALTRRQIESYTAETRVRRKTTRELLSLVGGGDLRRAS